VAELAGRRRAGRRPGAAGVWRGGVAGGGEGERGDVDGAAAHKQVHQRDREERLPGESDDTRRHMPKGLSSNVLVFSEAAFTTKVCEFPRK